jgi:FKBP-type peptidyl-prolyl cis-trans isomerase SlyD
MNIYVGNLPYKITESDIQDLFSPFGEVTSVKIIKDNYSGQSKGFGFVEMANSNEGQAAMKDLNGTSVQGREIIVNEARPQRKGTGGRNFRRWLEPTFSQLFFIVFFVTIKFFRKDASMIKNNKIRLNIVMCSIVCIAWAAFPANAETKKGEKNMTITPGKTVSIEYTLTLENKEVVDTNVGSDPLTYVQGSNQIIPGLENELEGMKVGDTKNVTVEPEDGYGPVIKEAIVEVKKEQLPAGACEVNSQVQAQGPDGQMLRGQVTELKDDIAIIDFNHPLAGETLVFEVKILDIQ